jgi:hypothetical protein
VPSRSPSAYEANPEEEKAKWAWMGNTDKFITVLKFVADNGEGFEILSVRKTKHLKPIDEYLWCLEIGMLNWYAVHGTSMNNKNRLV